MTKLQYKNVVFIAVVLFGIGVMILDPLRLLGLVTNSPSWVDKSGMEQIPLSRTATYIFLVPHIDDETLFAGATIAALADYLHTTPDHIKLIYTTTSTAGRPWLSEPKYTRSRRALLYDVAHSLGLERSSLYIPKDLYDGSQQSASEKYAGTLQWVQSQVGAANADIVLFTIGGNGNTDHTVAYAVGRTIARKLDIPLYVYWGYGKMSYWTEKYKTRRFPQVKPALLPLAQQKQFRTAKTEALKLYHRMYANNGWIYGIHNHYPDIIRYEWFHEDELGVLLP